VESSSSSEEEDSESKRGWTLDISSVSMDLKLAEIWVAESGLLFGEGSKKKLIKFF
jgi:hypothetical protein